MEAFAQEQTDYLADFLAETKRLSNIEFVERYGNRERSPGRGGFAVPEAEDTSSHKETRHRLPKHDHGGEGQQ